MGIFYKPPRHQQICWSAANDVKQPVPVITAKDEDRNRDRVGYQEVLRLTQQQKGYESNLETRSAHPILTDKSFTLRLEQFHEALVKAVVNIVDRWWEDRSANFPSRMPLETPVEGVLQVSDTFLLYGEEREREIFHYLCTEKLCSGFMNKAKANPCLLLRTV